MVATEHEIAPRRNPLWGLIKVLLYIVVKPLVLIFVGFRRYPLPSLIVAMVVLGSFFALTSGSVALPWSQANSAAPAGAASSRLATETYLTGQKEFNAALMWEAMSDELRQQMRQRGQSLEGMQQAMEEMKRRGLKYTEFKPRYITGTPLSDGRSVHLYVVNVTISAGEGQQSQEVPYTFVLNKAGKIEEVN